MRRALLIVGLVLAVGAAVVFKVLDARQDARADMGHIVHRPIDPSLFADSPHEPTFGTTPLISQLCTQSQLDSPALHHWTEVLKEQPHYHSKLWEYSFILQAISERGLMAPGKRGLGFGVGEEPLPSVFAKYGAEVVATDLDLATATKRGWAGNKQFMSSLDILNQRGIASNEDFHRLVTARNVDMTKIPDDLRDFDFTWSTCALGHLGTLDLGLAFIENSLKTLKPGGIAVHTTELNLSSNTSTVESGGTSIYRRQDIERLVKRLTDEGNEVQVNFNIGSGALDRYVDLPPYSADKHLRLSFGGYAVTSLGIVIRKGPVPK